MINGSNERVIATLGLSKRYGTNWAVKDCNLELPLGRVAALVGANGAGKSTFLRMVAGLTRPTDGTIHVLGERVRTGRWVPKRVGYLDQRRQLYETMRVEELLSFGAALNGSWRHDESLLHLNNLRIPLSAPLRSLSVGQHALVSLILCLAKCPDLLLLDEPMASLDPVARSMVLRILLGEVAERCTSVVLSSHVISELEPVCDFLVVMAEGRVVVANDLERVKRSHHFVVTSVSDGDAGPPRSTEVISVERSARQIRWLVRNDGPTVSYYNEEQPSLEEIVIAYMTREDARNGNGILARSGVESRSRPPVSAKPQLGDS